jgi:hypothetical protein
VSLVGLGLFAANRPPGAPIQGSGDHRAPQANRRWRSDSGRRGDRGRALLPAAPRPVSDPVVRTGVGCAWRFQTVAMQHIVHGPSRPRSCCSRRTWVGRRNVGSGRHRCRMTSAHARTTDRARAQRTGIGAVTVDDAADLRAAAARHQHRT